MFPGRLPASLAAAACLAWLSLTTGFAATASADPHDAGDLGGEPVPGGTGSTTPDDPTELDPGLWSDTLGGSATKNLHHFTYERRIKDSTVHVGVIGAPQSQDSDGIKVDVGYLDETGALTNCSSDDNSTGQVPQALIGARVDVGPSSAESTERTPCLQARTLQITVSRGYGSNTSRMPIAIKIVEEAPVSSAASLPAPEEEVAFSLPSPGSARELAGSASFADAPGLDPREGGVTVSTTLTQGTEQLWRVPVQWGQRVVVRATTPAGSEAELEGNCCGIPLRLRLIDPLRATFAYENDDQDSDGSFADVEDELVAGSSVLHYRNRYDDALPSVPGDFWVAVSAAPVGETSDLDPVDVPVELTVAVTGDPSGEPSYPEVVVSPSDGAGPGGYSPDKPFLVAEGRFAAVASGNPVVADDEDGWLTPRRWAGLGLGVVSAACLAAGAVRLRARR